LNEYVKFRVSVDSNYIYSKYLYDPITVLAASKIDVLPYQIEDFLSLLDMAEKGDVRVLIAYETGLGKTIVAGLFIKEMILRNENLRILILTPPNVRRQWKKELKEKFELDFELDYELKEKNMSVLDAQLLIASMDTLKGEAWLRQIREYNYTWDIVVVDELHRANEANLRAELIMEISKRTRHFLGLTATPHDGKEENFIFRLSLINPSVDETNYKEFLKSFAFRRKKSEVIDLDGKKIFPHNVQTKTLTIEPTKEEEEFYSAVENYIRRYYKLAQQENNRAIGLVATVIGRTVSSSIKAGVEALRRRLYRLTQEEVIKAAESMEVDIEKMLRELEQAQEEADDRKVEEIRNKVLTFVSPELRKLFREEEQILKELIEKGEKLLKQGHDSKINKLLSLIDKHVQNNEKIVVFTEFLDTLFLLKEILERKYGAEKIAVIHGGMRPREKDENANRLWGDAVILLATDAAGESLNLQAANVVINYEIPWNPVVFIQRVGRVYRYGQKKPNIWIYGILPFFKIERRVLEVVLRKIDTIKRDFDLGSVEIIGSIISERDIEKEIIQAYASEISEDEIAEDISITFEKRKKELLENVKRALQYAEAAKRHLRVEKLMKSKNVSGLILEQDLIRYLLYLRELGIVHGNITAEGIGYIGIAYKQSLNLENVQLKNKTTIEKEYQKVAEEYQIKKLKIDDPGMKKALILGLDKEGFGLFVWNKKSSYGEIRILTIKDGLGDIIYEIPVAILDTGEIFDITQFKSLEPVIEFEHLLKQKFLPIYKKKINVKGITNAKLIREIVEEQRSLLNEKINLNIRRCTFEINVQKRILETGEYLRQGYDKYLIENKIEELKKNIAIELTRRKISVEFSEKPIATFLLINISDLKKALEDISTEALQGDDQDTYKRVQSSLAKFDPTLWKKKREIELAAMEVVMWWERNKFGRIPLDVSADGRGYDIESKDQIENKTYYVEVKGFKEHATKVVLTENEYKAASFYGNRYILYIVQNAIDNLERIRSGIEPETPIIIEDPVTKYRFDVEYRPYYVLRL